MRPAAALVLGALAADLDRKLADPPHGAERMALWRLRAVIDVVAREADSSAATRLAELNELSGLLCKAAAICPQELQARLVDITDGAQGAEHDIRVSVLERKLDASRVALIEVHSWLETSTHSQARALLVQCWEFLVRANAKGVFHPKPW